MIVTDLNHPVTLITHAQSDTMKMVAIDRYFRCARGRRSENDAPHPPSHEQALNARLLAITCPNDVQIAAVVFRPVTRALKKTEVVGRVFPPVARLKIGHPCQVGQGSARSERVPSVGQGTEEGICLIAELGCCPLHLVPGCFGY